MKPDKAIEILTDLLGEGPQFPPDDRRNAVKLGIEALKWRAKWERASLPDKWPLLPGETEGVPDEHS